ncbi:type IV secretion system protein [Aliarcobacter cryaerophilus]|uniref:type IV secretion system protein n=1 Tax=Aliarcobacter cryaerophilus TaxID=28198 RepID=UPI003DA2EEAD
MEIKSNEIIDERVEAIFQNKLKQGKINMKKYLISAVLSTQLLFSSGIPTVDVLAIAQTLAQNIKEIAEWKETAERWSDTASHYSSQLTAYENELMSKTGIRDSVGFVKDLNRLQQYAKVYGDDYLDLAKAMANPSSQIGNLSRSLFNKYNVFDRCENQIYKDWEKENCKMKLQREVTQIATVQETKKMVDTSAENLEKLSKRVSSSQDIKDSQDIANAINMEMAQMQIIQMKIDMMEKNNQAMARAEEEQKQRQFESTLNKHSDFSKFNWSINKEK